jgi:hypothetical protein
MTGAREGVLAGSDEARLIEAGRWRPAPRIVDVRPALAVTALSNNQRFHPPFQ